MISTSHPLATQSGLDALHRGGTAVDAYLAAAAVPGWVSGAHTAWQRWGRLAWADAFSDALVYAREGFVVDQQLWGTMFVYRAVQG